MRYIQKGAEPHALVKWKARWAGEPMADWPRWLPRHVRPALRGALLAEQGHTCCYCGIRIRPEREGLTESELPTQVEHIVPRSGPCGDPALRFGYRNLVASCASPNGEHCGQKKGDWYVAALFVSPLDAACEVAFDYDPLGGVRADHSRPTSRAAVETIRRLGLDTESLQSRRRGAILRFITKLAPSPESERRFFIACRDGRLLEEFGLTPGDVTKLVAACESMNTDDEHLSFGWAVRSVLMQYAPADVGSGDASEGVP